MAIASMVCGIVGIIGFIISGLRLQQLNQLRDRIDGNLVGVILQWQVDNQITTATVFFVLSIILLILALIFGIIERKKGKTYKYYKMATAGFILGIMPIILVFIMILFTTATVIIVNVNNSGRAQTVVSDPSSPYIGSRPAFSYFDIGRISVRTRDLATNFTVSVEMIIGYDESDQNTLQELNNRRIELRDFTRRYFSEKTAAELAPEREESLKADIREQLNTRFLDTRGVRIILFNRLDIEEIEE